MKKKPAKKKKVTAAKITAMDVVNTALKKMGGTDNYWNPNKRYTLPKGKVYGKSPATSILEDMKVLEAKTADAAKELFYGEKPNDPVNHPAHYTQGGIECIDAIRAALTEEEFRGFCKGNLIKYAWRERHKGGDESLRKGEFYSRQLTEPRK